MPGKNIRNFSIIAHIDHGKSTLADRLLEYTHTLAPRQIREQTLDTMDLERERGITIKAHTIRLIYSRADGQKYILNLIDTPGHVDFSYEVSRSLAACEGTLLLIDAVPGVEAQTIANFYLAKERNLRIIPIINKMDLPLANPERIKEQLKQLPGINPEEAILVSARDGRGIKEVLEAIVKKIPPPSFRPEAPLKALIFDSFYDMHRGVVGYIRLMEGSIHPGKQILVFSSGKKFKVEEVGILRLKKIPREKLVSGEVGYFMANIKEISDLRVGDTITDTADPTTHPCPGYQQPQPMVLCGFYPTDGESFENLRQSLNKLSLNDPAFIFHPESSPLLGLGFRCGFLGLLHKEIIQERLEREFNLGLIATAPHVLYHLIKQNGQLLKVDNPAKFPTTEKIKEIKEPYIKASIITPQNYLGAIFELLEKRRGKYLEMKWLDSSRVILLYKIPLGEVALKFYDELKSVSQGYASFDYQHIGYEPGDLVKVDILVHGQVLDALSFITHKEKAYPQAKVLVQRLKKTIPHHLFPVSLQAAIGKNIIARETISALRKDVTAPLYGGDITRKRKLLEQQKRGKKRMKKFGQINIPQSAFLAVLESQ